MSIRITMVMVLLSTLPVATRAFDYDEDLDGDIASYDETTPTPLGSLDTGANILTGTVTTETDWGDVFSVEVPSGHTITSIDVEVSEHTGDFNAGTRVFETPVYSSLGIHVFPGNGSYSYSAILPLPAPGPYGFTAAMNSVSDIESYTWQWTITTVPEPASDALSVTAAALLLLGAGSRSQRTRGLGRRSAPRAFDSPIV
ncbi:hypothetical protein KJ059_01445 [Myxococcota bacterium]|nr:hypothetical protein [Myxococcota bacterium]